MTNRPDCWPWLFKKDEHGRWWRRPSRTTGAWQVLTVTRIGDPVDPPNVAAGGLRKRTQDDRRYSGSINEWTWDLP